MKRKSPAEPTALGMGSGLTRRQALAAAGAGFATMHLGMLPAFAQQGGAIKRGGQMTIMLELDTSSLDPLFGNATTIQRKFYNIYAESLLLQDRNGFQPWLAESYELQDGGKTIIFKLRRGVTFTDGTPFNADAAKINLDRLVDPALKPYPKQYVRELKSIDKIDDYTIKLNLSSPSVLMLPSMAGEPGMMISPVQIKEKSADIARMPIGTGPFKIVSRTTGETVAEKNPNYWQKGADGKPLPYLDGIKVIVNGNATVRLLQVQSGAAQLADPVSAKDFDRVKSNPALQLLDAQLGGAFVISFNMMKGPTTNIDLRKAMALAIDRQALVKVISQGQGVVLTGLEPPHSWVYDPSLKGHPYDPAGAKAALAKSGFTGSLTLTIQQREDDALIAQIIQQMYKAIGLDMKIETLERLAFVEKVLSAKEFDFVLTASPLQRPDMHTQYTFSYSRNATTNYSGFKDEEIFDLVDKALVELDRAKRKPIYVKIQQLVLDKYIQTFLLWNPRRQVASSKLKGIRYEGSDIWLYDQMWTDA
jgi:peptide/nickel transport system substrate-binding protein